MMSWLKILANRATARQRVIVAEAETKTEPGDLTPRCPPWSWGDLEIRSILGRGSFGEVYLAWDTKLQREVALKLVSSRSAPLDEARLIARVRHSNIISIHQVDERGGLVGIQMELINGTTLEKKLQQHGRFGFREASLIGADICRALGAVHGGGLLHRDIKTQNVMREDGGRIVLMDFGLGQVAGQAKGDLAGTLPYMAPELFEGGAATRQSDIYATGVLLYRLVTGAFPVTARDAKGYLEAHRNGVGRHLSDLRPDLPYQFATVVERALASDRARRYRTAGEMNVALTAAAEARGSARKSRWWATVAVVTLVVIGAASGVWRWRVRSLPETQLDLKPFTLDPGVTDDPTISDDGRTVAYVSDRDTRSGMELYAESAAHLGQPRRLTFDGADKSEPSLSPDAQWVAFRSERAGGGIYVMPVWGGDPQLVIEGGHTPRFSPDGSRITYWTGDEGELPHVPVRIFIVGSRGGVPRQLASGFAGGRYPVWTPDGNHILFEGLRDPALSWDKSSEWDVLDLATGRVVETGAQTALRTRGLTPFAMPSNFRGSSFVGAARGEQATNLYGIDLSPRTWRLARPPRQLTKGTNVFMSPWIAASGKIIAASLEGAVNIWRIPEHRAVNEHPQAVTSNTFLNAVPSVSLDGRLLTFSRSLGRLTDIWLRDFSKPPGSETGLFASPEEKYSIILRPDGKEVAFSMNEGGRHAIYILVLSTGGPERIKLCSACGDPTGWSPSMEDLLVSNGSPSRIELRPRGGGEPFVLLQRADYELGEAQFSPDGSWIAFRAGLGGDRLRLYVAPYRPNSFIPPEEWIPITEGKFWEDKPRWSTDGSAIYFQSMRDNFSCLWVQKLDWHSRRPIGRPSAFIDFHSKKFGLSPVSSEKFNLTIGGGYLFFNAADLRANVWIGSLASVESPQQ